MSVAVRSPNGRRRINESAFPGSVVLSYTVAGVLALMCVLPLAYMISLAFQSDAEVSGAAVLLPKVWQWENLGRIFDVAPFGRYLLNSVLVAASITIAHLVFDPLVGYVFAKFDFPLKGFFFGAILATLMIPFFVRMLPLYILFSNLGWLNTYQGLIVPFLMDAFGIFLIRQAMMSVPDELGEAARVDGASEFRIYRSIVLPQVRPALAVLGLFSFVFQMNEFICPLIATSSDSMRLITIALPLFQKDASNEWNLTAMAALLLFVPICLVFVLTQKYIVRGIAMSGIK